MFLFPTPERSSIPGLWAPWHGPNHEAITPSLPEECALKYHYHGTDYEKEIPKRIEVSSKDLGDGTWRVRIHDPISEDDSIFESVSRIYLEKNPEGRWQPVKAEHVHKARGRFGWTTKPGN